MKNTDPTSNIHKPASFKDAFTSSFKFVFNTILISIILVIGAYIGITWQSQVSNSVKHPASTASAITPEPSLNQGINQKPEKPLGEEIIITKPIEGGQLVARRLVPETSLGADVFSISLESGEHYPVIYSTSSRFYDQTQLFEIVDDQIFIVNSQKNQVDIYKYQIPKVEDGIRYLGKFTYIESIELPEYKIGEIYAINCAANNCHINTAHQLESGCSMDLNIQTQEFTNLICADAAGEFPATPS